MPSNPLRPCGHPGCTAINEKPYCDEHRKAKRSQEGKDRRTAGKANPLYKKARWQRLRLVKLRRDPLCQRCSANGRTEAATDVHHIRPANERADLVYEMSNLESLCHGCHSRETAREVGWGR